MFEFLAEVAWRNLAQDVQHDLRVDTYRHIQTLEHGFFEERQTGDLQAVLNDDVNQLERFLDVGANELIQLVTTVVVIGTTFFGIAPQVAWWSFLPVPVVLWGAFWFQRRLEPRYAEVRDRAGVLNASLGNRLLGMATVKSFGAEEREADRIAAESRRLPAGQPRRHPAQRGLHPAHPHGDRGRASSARSSTAGSWPSRATC